MSGLLTVKDVADRLQVSERTAWALIKSGEIECVRIGRLVRVRESDLAVYLEGDIPFTDAPEPHVLQDDPSNPVTEMLRGQFIRREKEDDDDEPSEEIPWGIS